MIRLLLVDDQPGTRRGLRMRLALEPDLVVVGEAADGAAALPLARDLSPDVVIMDVEMPVMDGIRATSELRTIAPDTHVVILSLYDDPATRAKASAAGACAFVAKQCMEEPLLSAIRQAATCGHHGI